MPGNSIASGAGNSLSNGRVRSDSDSLVSPLELLFTSMLMASVCCFLGLCLSPIHKVDGSYFKKSHINVQQ